MTAPRAVGGPPIRVYADTSVYGGMFDPEFADASAAFLDRVRAGRFRLVSSLLVADEIENAPDQVRDLYASMLPLAEIVEPTDEARRLQAEYLRARILGPRSAEDALHVAVATVSGCALIVSWNFRHIVHFQKIPLYNAVNVLNGYAPIAIHTPLEVRGDEEEL
jgi:hypothetical protein